MTEETLKDINGKKIREKHILLDKDNNKWVVYLEDGLSYKPLNNMSKGGAYFLTSTEIKERKLKIIGKIFRK